MSNPEEFDQEGLYEMVKLLDDMQLLCLQLKIWLKELDLKDYQLN